MAKAGGPVRDIAVDLGTSLSLAAVRGRGIAVREPTVAAVDRNGGKVLCTGEDARQLLDRTTGRLLAMRPMEAGVLRDGALGEALLRDLLQKAAPGRVFKPRLLLAVPTGAAPVDERALVDAGLRAGARRVYLMEGPLAAALGAGVDAETPGGHLVADVGGGTADIAAVALGGVVTSICSGAAGDAFDRALQRYIREEHGVLVGRRTAEAVKKAVGRVSAAGEEQGEPFPVKGRCLTTGLPREIALPPGETARALDPVAEVLVRSVLEVLERTPRPLAADIAAEGILLTGGGGLLRGLDRLLAERTGFPVVRPEDPEGAVVLGLEKSLAGLSRRRDGVLDLARRRAVAGE